MLKIKDEIDLKELEKFGFEDNYNRTSLIKNFERDYGTDDYIAVNKESKVIKLEHYQDEYGATDIFGVDILLYDLIKADMVEKV